MKNLIKTALLVLALSLCPVKSYSQGRTIARITKKVAKTSSNAIQYTGSSLVDCFRSKIFALECAALVASTVLDARATNNCAQYQAATCFIVNPLLGTKPNLVQIISVGITEDIALLDTADYARQGSPVLSIISISTPITLHIASTIQNNKIAAELKRQGVLK